MALPDASTPVEWARIVALANGVFSTELEAQVWLETPHPLLGGLSPKAAGATAEGALKVWDFLVTMKYGGVA